MSFRNRHMRQSNILAGVRGCMVLRTYAEAFTGATWDNIKELFVNHMEYGWTKYPDVYILAHYINSHFMLRKTMRACGYGEDSKKTPGASILVDRLRRMNVLSLLAIHDAMIDNGLIGIRHMKPVLEMNIPEAKKGNGKRIYDNEAFLFYTKSLVTDALAKAKAPRVKNVANKFGTTQKVINYWAELEVEDIRVQSMD